MIIPFMSLPKKRILLNTFLSLSDYYQADYLHEYTPTIVVSESEFFFCNLLIFFADISILYSILSKILQKLDPNLICCILLMEKGKDFNDPLLVRHI